MKLSLLVLLLSANIVLAQYEYESTAEYPFGRQNPDAPEQLQDFALLIGSSQCQSERRSPDQTWADPIDMTWNFKYIMNGTAIQDETLKADKIHSGSIRQFSQDSSRWYVHFYSTPVSTTLSTWEGNLNDDDIIVLFKDQLAPNGTEGFSRLTFYDISDNGFKWKGEWINKEETIVYPFWKISCEKQF